MQGRPGARCTVRRAMSGLAERTFQTPAMRASHFYRWRASALLYGCDLEIKSRTPTLFWFANLKIQGRSIFKGARAHQVSHTHTWKRDRRLKCAISTVIWYMSKQGPLGKVNSLLAHAVMTVGSYAEDTLMMQCVKCQKVSRVEGQVCAFSLLAQFLRGSPRRIFIW